MAPSLVGALLVSSLALASAVSMVRRDVGVKVNVTVAVPTSHCSIPPRMQKIRIAAGLEMVVLSQGDVVSDSLRMHGTWEQISSAGDMLARGGMSVQSGGHPTFLDIGANLGYYSLLFAQAGYNVVAVEAMTHNVQAIQASLCLNPQLKDRVNVVHTAVVSPSQTHLRCRVMSTNGLMNKANGQLKCGTAADVDCADRAPGSICEGEISVQTLDAVLEKVHPASIDVMKMDIETFECNALAGGQSMFTKYSPKFMHVETAYSGKQCWAPVVQAHGYRMIDHGGDTVWVK